MKIAQDYFKEGGSHKGIYLFVLRNDNGMEVSITNYGATVTSIKVPDASGKIDEVITGFDTLEDYEKEHPYFGVICGRYANRIAKGQFTLDGVTYHLPINNGPNSLHGGNKGFDKVIWQAESFENKDAIGVKLNYLSRDGEEGYPGNMQVTVIYSLNNLNELTIEYHATTDKPTVVNLTNHCYFNLAGCNQSIYDLVLTIDADKITEVDDTSIPTGKLLEVAGTPFDFRTPTRIGDRIHQVPEGFDHNYILNKAAGRFDRIATLFDPRSGRKMHVYTTEPGVQFYSANYLDGSQVGHSGIRYQKHCSLCLETQHFPDSPNHPHFPSTVLRPEEKYYQKTVYAFSW
ncbi:MAG TPA: aldose epimerase family protein [Bacteroidales bacterium]|nr:aldose epimerase family protein [Bacteroidales bacterium]HOK99545.1 aldose epimerase family protein [Bacteroidales bacterium]HPO66391.1 aldose epimerase family protein [Bacteroidales bacterium]